MKKDIEKIKDYGRATILALDSAVVGRFGTWTITYSVGESGIAIGGGIRIEFPLSWNEPKVTTELGCLYEAGYTTISVSRRNTISTKANLRWLTIEIKEVALREGDTITVVYGNRSKGGPGARPASIENNKVEFKIFVDINGYGNYRSILSFPSLKLKSAKASKIAVTIPSTMKKGDSYIGIVKAVDFNGNIDSGYQGKIEFLGSSEIKITPTSYGFGDKDKGMYKFKINCQEEGLSKIRVKNSGNKLFGISNPARIVAPKSGYNIYWGDIHSHTDLSDGVFTIDDCYSYARDIANLDFCSITDHDYSSNPFHEVGIPLTDKKWELIKKKAAEYNDSGEFVTLLAYEYGNIYPATKCHRNIYYLDNDEPFYAYISEGSRRPSELFENLRGKKAIVVPHHTLAWGSFYHDPTLQRLIEIYSVWGSSEYKGNPDWCGISEEKGISVQDFLARGYRLGIIASGDNHDRLPGHPGISGDYATPAFMKKYSRSGLVAVYSKKLTREAIFDALWNRRCYATTGERILLEFRINNHMMGEEFTVSKGKTNRKILVDISGTNNIKRVDLIRNNITIHTHRGSNSHESFEYLDKDDLSGLLLKIANPAVFYYIRVKQVDGNIAWSSPIWVSLK